MLGILGNYNSRDLPSALDILDELLDVPKYLESSYCNSLGSPISYEKTAEGVKIEIVVPGYGKDDLELKFNNNILRLKNKVEEKEGSTKSTINYKIRLPKNINESTIKSKCEKGLLTVDAEFNKPQEGRTITII
jgi:HSP20 family molecular chaperone IbpA